RRVPPPAVTHGRDRQAVDRVASTVANEGVHLPEVVGHGPRTVVVFGFDGGEKVAAADAWRDSYQRALVAVGAAADPHQRTSERIRVVDVGGASGREITLLGEVRPLRELHATDEPRNQEI